MISHYNISLLFALAGAFAIIGGVYGVGGMLFTIAIVWQLDLIRESLENKKK